MKPEMTRDILQTLMQHEVMTVERMQLRSGWDVKQGNIDHLIRERLIAISDREGATTYRITNYGRRILIMLTESLEREARGRR